MSGIGIVGGGILGLGLADKLAAAGHKVTVYESSGQLGGLAGSTELGGVRVAGCHGLTGRWSGRPPRRPAIEISPPV